MLFKMTRFQDCWTNMYLYVVQRSRARAIMLACPRCHLWSGCLSLHLRFRILRHPLHAPTTPGLNDVPFFHPADNPTQDGPNRTWWYMRVFKDVQWSKVFPASRRAAALSYVGTEESKPSLAKAPEGALCCRQIIFIAATVTPWCASTRKGFRRPLHNVLREYFRCGVYVRASDALIVYGCMILLVASVRVTIPFPIYPIRHRNRLRNGEHWTDFS